MKQSAPCTYFVPPKFAWSRTTLYFQKHYYAKILYLFPLKIVSKNIAMRFSLSFLVLSGFRFELIHFVAISKKTHNGNIK